MEGVSDKGPTFRMVVETFRDHIGSANTYLPLSDHQLTEKPDFLLGTPDLRKRGKFKGRSRLLTKTNFPRLSIHY